MNSIPEGARNDWANAAHPGHLFLAFWLVASAWQPADRSIASRPVVVTRNALTAAALLDSGQVAVAAILSVLSGDWPVGDSHADRLKAAGLLLEAMRAIDDAYTALHPRTRTVAPSVAAVAKIPGWLEAAERRRHRYGSYAEADGYRLIPSGPFSRHARGRDASAADALQDRFPILTVAPSASHEGDRLIYVDMQVIGTDVMRGVPASRSIGRERVRFIPLAEAKADLAFETFDRAGQMVLDVQPTLDLAARLLGALDDGADVDLAFAPELTVPVGAEGSLSAGIAKLANLAPRIILAGTGLTNDKGECGRSWNEARVFGRGGQLLWRQRKIWPFGMQRAAAIRYGLADPGQNGVLMEDIAGNSHLTVVDLDGFGRCVVLICQDLQAHPVVEEIVGRYQPDWILTPVLDPGVKIPGWAHSRALELSRRSQARVMVSSSLTLAHHSDPKGAEAAVGLAVGPADPTMGPDGKVAPSRAVALVRATTGPSPRAGLLVWDHLPPTWKQSSIGMTT